MIVVKYGDTGNELLKRKGLKITIMDGQPTARRTNISPIHTMYERSVISIAQFSAGKKLYECYVSAWGNRGNYEIRERVDGGSKAPELTTSQIHCMKELKRGMKAAGMDKELIEKVCINEQPLTRRGMGGYERNVLIYQFRRGLNRVAEVYGFK
jgi:hypothetical protein